ncbi:sulfatase family protein [Phycisphaera mikurensis]|uniref:Putative sulfatase n=1 Tax=Phycisphaera mikurensis (strain NBRC 102666 / KCTC 22515 / FYK2301M01) TaxID=1142394 RepID=I0IBN3_PHYMF|nr:sulfatase [Phycisphaera mikurensis]MBB6442800.1 arylsulfatase A-like enzyme [Phycisphaera mikurensis]BAM02671.1 putative sulfatase [Phycisphaera mikurensis NBRC 102666]
MPPLNVLYLHSHDTGRFVRPHGHAVPTPNLQAFAERGVLFRQAFSAGPTCSPSRATLFTGRPPHAVGMYGLAHEGWSLEPGCETLVTTLGRAGYRTVLGGFQHLTAWADDDWRTLGYAAASPARNGTAAERTAAACAFLRGPHDRPFFLDLGFIETHRRGDADRDGEPIQWHNGRSEPLGDPRYVRVPATLPDTPATRTDFADFLASAERLDRCCGEVLAALDAAGLREDTIVLITTDHGIAFPGMKCNLTDHGTGVLMMLAGPERLGLAGGRVIDAMVTHADVFPSLCGWLGLPEPPGLTGRSLAPLLDGRLDPAQPDALHDAVFTQVNHHLRREVERAIRTPRFKYIRRYQDDPITAHSTDASVSERVMREAGWGEQPLPAERLHDLWLDPQESCDLAAGAEHAGTVAALRGSLEAWMRRHGDPALRHAVPEPAR